MNKELEKRILNQQRNELTEYLIYSHLSKAAKNKHNTKILKQIGDDELKHHNFWRSVTKKDVKPKTFKIWHYTFISKVFGLAFGLKLMERGEEDAQVFYNSVAKDYPHVKQIAKEEEEHEKKLVRILEDERVTYAGAIVLGLNDALVELTGTLAGLSIAFQNSFIIGITGVIMGIAAAMSMTASGYLSSQEESDEKNPVRSALYTGFAYLITVVLLVIPYFLIQNVFTALGVMLLIALLIIATYTFYISVAKEQSFWKRFLQMALISLGVAVISFGIGLLVKNVFGIEL